MKKFVKVALAAVMAVSVLGVSSTSVMAKKSNKEVITVGISPDYKPYESLNKKNKMVGFDIDMVKWFGKYLSKEEGKKVTFQFKQMDFDNIVTQLQGDQVDLGISGFTYSEDRKVEWSEPYLGSSRVAVVPNGSDITSVDQLEGKSLVAQTGATGEKAAKDVKDAQVTGLKNVQDIMNALGANQYDAAVVDSGVAKQYAQSGQFTTLDGSLLDEKNYIIAKEGNKEMIDKVNKAIEAFIASDDYKKLCDKYDLTPIEG